MDGWLVPLPPGVRAVAARDAARAMIGELAGAGFAPLVPGQLARWGHLALAVSGGSQIAG